MLKIRLTIQFFAAAAGKLSAVSFCCAFVLVLALSASAQEQQPGQTQPAAANPAPEGGQQPANPPPAEAQSPAQAASQAPSPISPSQAHATTAKDSSQAGEIKEDELKQMLVGKPLYLRGGYLDNSLSFNDHGILIGTSPKGSFTLCGVQVDRVHLSKHKLELEGARYALRFTGGGDDAGKTDERVRITPKKKMLKISIERQQVELPKKSKEKNKDKKATTAKNSSAPPTAVPTPGTVTPAQASAQLRSAIDTVFSNGIDDRLIAAMPDYWKIYFTASASKLDYRPTDPAVLRQTTVDKKAKLVSAFEPPSNEYAQAHAVAGLAIYYAIVGADGKPGEIAVGRPIGFGLWMKTRSTQLEKRPSSPR